MIINTREDLDSTEGTVEYFNFIQYLIGSTINNVDSQIYPENYNQPDHAGEKLEPIWQDVEDLSIVERFGFTKEELIKISQSVA
jgi:hypothetical protein